MNITIHSSFLPHNDAEAALAFYRDSLGFELRKDVGYQGMRWLTVGPVNQPDTCIVLHPPGVNPGITEAERGVIAEMMAKAPTPWSSWPARISMPPSRNCRRPAPK